MVENPGLLSRALSLTETIRAFAVDSGVVTPSAEGSNVLGDSTKDWPTDVHRNRLVKIILGTGMGQLRAIPGNTKNVLMISPVWNVLPDRTSVYVIFDTDLMQMLRDVFGGGADISAANPLEVHDPGVGSHDEDSGVGVTTNAWADALDWNTRELSDKTILLTNTDVANSLNYRVYTRAYYAGQDFTEVAAATLAPAAQVRIALNNHYARVIVQVIDTAPPAHAAYQIDWIGRRF